MKRSKKPINDNAGAGATKQMHQTAVPSSHCGPHSRADLVTSAIETTTRTPKPKKLSQLKSTLASNINRDEVAEEFMRMKGMLPSKRKYPLPNTPTALSSQTDPMEPAMRILEEAAQALIQKADSER